jgi:hypothetical protein
MTRWGITTGVVDHGIVKLVHPLHTLCWGDLGSRHAR